MNRALITVTAATILAAAAASVPPAAAAPYPERPIRLIVPTTAGSIPDQVARLLRDRMASELGQPITIENRSGAGGTIGLDAVAKAAPDGYTLGIHALPYVVAPMLLAKVPYDTEKDLAPVTLINWSYQVVIVPAASKAQSVADLVALATANPSGLRFSSQGNGTPTHLILTLFGKRTGANLMHVPYKGGPASLTAVLAADVDVSSATPTLAGPHIKAGTLRALATTAPRRIPAYPELPTLLELGYSGVDLSDWQGIVVPAGTPREVIDRLHSTIAKILMQPDIRQTMATMGIEPAGMGPDDFAAHQRREIDKWRDLVREARITAD